MNATARTVRTQLLIAVMCVAMLAYFVLLGRSAVALIASGRAAAVGLGLAVLVMPVIGLWAMIATLRTGFAHQKLARLIAADGLELDTSALPRRASGRIERDAADALFASVRTEVEADPDDWRRWYRLARAYDYAGDRRRARQTMKTALSLHGVADG
jgi:cytochrome c-type biogenesis protein CcmH/NrfG